MPLVCDKCQQAPSSDSGAALRGPAFPGEPRVKVEDAGSVGESRRDSALDGNSVILDFREEGLAESNCTLKSAIRSDFDSG